MWVSFGKGSLPKWNGKKTENCTRFTKTVKREQLSGKNLGNVYELILHKFAMIFFFNYPDNPNEKRLQYVKELQETKIIRIALLRLTLRCHCNVIREKKIHHIHDDGSRGLS